MPDRGELDRALDDIKAGKGLTPDEVRRALGRPAKERQLIAVTIHGHWTRTPEEVRDILDAALHAAGLCGCWGPGNGYTMSVALAEE